VSARRTLLEIFDAALRAVDGCRLTTLALQVRPPGRTAVFAIGKAASAMARGAVQALGDDRERLLLISKDGHIDDALRRLSRATCMESAHPVPDERSLAAGAELERQVLDVPAGVTPLFLVSGGSSSLVEQLHAGHTLEELRALNQHGLGAGWDIAMLNARRARLSRLKQGGVARLLAGRAALALFISDVPGDDPRVIGSGLLGPDAGREDRIERRILASIDSAVQAAIEAGRARGLELEAGPRRFAGDVHGVAGEFVGALRATAADGLVWGGESTVTLPARHGRGGRNTHLALCAARMLRAGEPLALLAAGTDGSDGPTADAGALVDAATVERAELAGCDVERARREFDSGLALEMSGDLVHTGPTGTNVGDIVIGLKHSPRAARGRDAVRVL